MRTFSPLLYHLLIGFCVIVWASTFASTHLLLKEGMGSVEIVVYRFAIAYLCLLAVSHKRLFSNSLKDELLLFSAALTGGSVFFIAQNMAIQHTTTVNVAILMCTAPIMTAVLAHFVDGDKLRTPMLIGSAVALLGVILVVTKGDFNVRFNLHGDLLTIFAAFLWAIYCIVLRRLSKRYSSLFITRKVFAYSLLSLLLYHFYTPLEMRFDLLAQPFVWGSLLYLGVVASMICFLIWSAALPVLGPTTTSNYNYLQPFIALAVGYFALGESVTWVAVAGALLIIGGVIYAERG